MMKMKGLLSGMKKFLSEFKAFAVKGNMIDMAVGIIVGGAFSALVSSIVSDIATPLIGILIGVDFKEWVITLPRLYGNAPASTLAIGTFINNIISFFIVAFTVFLFLKVINKLRKKQDEVPPAPPAPPEPTKEELLLTDIRDILKSQRTD